jgi:hypothetical protein
MILTLIKAMRVAHKKHVGKKGTIIELNGKRYNALTGELLKHIPETAKTTTAPAAKPRPYGGEPSAAAVKSMDGFFKPVAASAVHKKPVSHAVAPRTSVVAAKPQPAAQKAAKKPVMDVQRPGGVGIVHHAPKKSQTLMRSTVRRPEPSIRRKTKVTSHTHALVAQPEIRIVKKLSHPKIDPKRVQRSSTVPQSELIHRFAAPAALPVAAPKPQLALNMAAVRPVYASTPAAHAVSAPMDGASSMDVFERALQRANSHVDEPISKPRKGGTKRRKSGLGKRALSMSTAALALLVLFGFIAFQNQANLTVRYASNKAGFSASLPAYKPAGYSVGKFTYSPGQVGVQYKNNASGQSFSVVQKQSGWDSQALRDDYVATNAQTYKTIESAGRTIYTYGNNSATWVNGGVWYQVSSAGSLTTEELVNLATSM